MTEAKTEQLCCSSRVLEAKLLKRRKRSHPADCKGATLVPTPVYPLALILKDGDSGEAGDISSNTSISPVCLFPSFPLFTLISYSVKRSQAEKRRIGNSPNKFVLFLRR